jgi:hypothetical protein
MPSPAAELHLKTLFNFCVQGDCTDVRPLSELVLDEKGSLYGVALVGGDAKAGSVFRLVPDKTGTQWTATTLYSFCSQNGCADGGYPYSGLIRDPAGNLYGTTQQGGTANYANGGVVYQLRPDKTGNSWKEAVLHSFCSQSHCADGSRPHEGLVMDRQGNLYGTTQYGGNHNADPMGRWRRLPIDPRPLDRHVDGDGYLSVLLPERLCRRPCALCWPQHRPKGKLVRNDEVGRREDERRF